MFLKIGIANGNKNKSNDTEKQKQKLSKEKRIETKLNNVFNVFENRNS